MSPDTKRLITGMLLALAVIVGYNWLLRTLYPNWRPEQRATQPSATQPSGTQPSGTQPAETQPSGTRPTQPTVTTAPSTGTFIARPGPATRPITLGSAQIDDKNYTMAVQMVAPGAAINEVVLNEFRKSAESKTDRYAFQEPYVLDGAVREESRSMLTRSVTIDNNVVDLSNVNWVLEKTPAGKSPVEFAHWTIDIVRRDNEKPVARIHKFIDLSKKSDNGNSNQGWEIFITHRIENLSTDQQLVAKFSFNGPTAPPRELERQPDQNLVVGYWKDGKIEPFGRLLEGEFTKDKPTLDFTKNEKGLSMVWSGMQSAYFNAIVRPVPIAANDFSAGWVAKAWGELLNPGVEKPDDRRVVIRFDTADFTVPAGKSADSTLETYFGPKSRGVLNTAYYASLPLKYDETLVVSTSSNWCGWICASCTWQWLINVLVALLSFFHLISRDWGVAIILLVVLVRALLHPITKKSQVHMVKMQKMGPELEKLKKKFADDKEALAREQMKFYKEQGFTPVLGCLPMFLQMPIWICLWNALQSTFELRLSPFLYGLTWIHDLAKPDYLVKFSQSYHFLFLTISGINVLPILMGVVFYLQTKFQPKPPTMTPEQESQQKMMTWMTTLLFPIMLYTGPSGLNLYILTSTAFGILESKVIRKHIKEREELEAKMGPTIIDAPPPGKNVPKSNKEQPQQKKGWLQRLMDKAEDMKRQADKDRRKK